MKYIYLNLIAFFGLIATYLALHYGYFLNIDNIVSSFYRSNFLVWFFFIVTDIGELALIFIGSIFLVTLLAIQGKYKAVFYSLISLLGGLASQSIIKNVLTIGRPENSFITSWGYAFPSGHTNMTTILFLCFCFYVLHDLFDKKRRVLYFTISILVIILVGLSRVYLNAHWVSDVLAGWCLGLFWATAPLAVVKIRNIKRLGSRSGRWAGEIPGRAGRDNIK